MNKYTLSKGNGQATIPFFYLDLYYLPAEEFYRERSDFNAQLLAW